MNNIELKIKKLVMKFTKLQNKKIAHLDCINDLEHAKKHEHKLVSTLINLEHERQNLMIHIENGGKCVWLVGAEKMSFENCTASTAIEAYLNKKNIDQNCRVIVSIRPALLPDASWERRQINPKQQQVAA